MLDALSPSAHSSDASKFTGHGSTLAGKCVKIRAVSRTSDSCTAGIACRGDHLAMSNVLCGLTKHAQVLLCMRSLLQVLLRQFNQIRTTQRRLSNADGAPAQQAPGSQAFLSVKMRQCSF